MKLILSVLFFTSIASATPCPDLSGTFQCSIDPDEAKDTGVISIKTDNTFNTTIYVIRDEDYPEDAEAYVTDNKVYQLEDDDQTYQGWCENNSFKYVLKETDEEYGEIIGEVILKLDKNSNLVSKGILTFQGKKYQSNDVCKKL